MIPRRNRIWAALAFAHRWLGIAGCLLFLLWFVSGVAMMYVRMPELSTGERLAHAAPLAAERIRVAPSDAVRIADADYATAIGVAMLNDRPVYRVGGRAPVVVYADTGERLQPPTAAAAAVTAREFLGAATPSVRHVERLETPDQWTLQLRQYLPLHRLIVEGPGGAELYVSGRTGEVVLDTTRRERLLAYVGPVAHWLYLPVLRRNGPLWTSVVIWSSTVGCAVCLSGLIVGVWRFSPRRRFRLAQGPVASPYDGWLKWHHYAGLFVGVVTLTWTFSGLLSMGPFALLSNNGLDARVATAVTGAPITAAGLSPSDVHAAARALQADGVLKEMRLTAFQNQQFWVGTGSPTEHRLVSATSPGTAFERFPPAEIEHAARRAADGAPAELTWLTAYDEYYYDRSGQRPLPVLRARYADSAATWAYIDPAQGAVVLTLGDRDRLNRWLYNGLHSLDPAWLRDRRPLWDVVVILLSLGGTAGIVTSLTPAWRRVRRLLLAGAACAGRHRGSHAPTGYGAPGAD